MSYLRQRPRVPATGKIRVTLSPEQRDLVLGTKGLPKDLGHLLHRAPVRRNKLEIRLGRQHLMALITAVLVIPASDRRNERALHSFLRYLEEREEQFEQPEVPDAPPPDVEGTG